MTKAQNATGFNPGVAADATVLPPALARSGPGQDYAAMVEARRQFLAAYRRWLVESCPAEADAIEEAVGTANVMRQCASLIVGEGLGHG